MLHEVNHILGIHSRQISPALSKLTLWFCTLGLIPSIQAVVKPGLRKISMSSKSNMKNPLTD